jgi:hypothetical protein
VCGETRNAYRVAVGKPEEKRPLEGSTHRWEDNIKMHLGAAGWIGADLINLVQDDK